jgi:hypothetical protein
VQYDGKYASRWRTKPLGGLCAVLPIVLSYIYIIAEKPEKTLKSTLKKVLNAKNYLAERIL